MGRKGTEGERERKKEGLMVRNYEKNKRVIVETEREKREMDIRQECEEALFLRRHSRISNLSCSF
jgi:ribosomal protein L14